MDVEFLKYKFQDGYDGVITKTKFKIGLRHVQVLYMFLCSVVMGAMRGSVGIEVLAIVDSSHRNDSYTQIRGWDRRVQGTILSSFFFGYALMLIPAELHLKRLGDKFVITSVLLINGALSAAMPTIVNKGGWAAMCNTHFLMGMTQACLSPISQALLLKWLPPIERRTFAYFIDGGIYLGFIVAFPLAGMLNESRLSWELIFYSKAIMTLSMAIMWSLLTATSPDDHQAVSDFEKEYIREASAGYRKKTLQTPWRSILASRQVWAIASAHAAANVLFIFYFVDMPLYLKSTGISLKECAQQSMLPFIALWVTHLMTASSVNWFYKSGFLDYMFNAAYLRKSVNALGRSHLQVLWRGVVMCARSCLEVHIDNGIRAFSIVIGLTILPNITVEWIYLRFTVLIGTLGLLGFQYSGFLENLRDLSQNYSGTLIVLIGTVASLAGATEPLVAGLVLGNDVESPARWRLLLSLLAGLYALCNILYTVLASSHRPGWDDPGRYKFGYHNSILAQEDTHEMELSELDQRKGKARTEYDTPV